MKKALKIHVFGIVQGVGFRPTVSRHAMEYQVAGSVCNMGPYVEIHVQGEEEAVDGFLQAVRDRSPERAVILKMNIEENEYDPALSVFEIIESGKVQGDIFVSPDIAICSRCRKEMYDPKDRRYLHPFINCTCCGPRLTILDGMPYDRVRTSMADFPMCPECEYEYTHPETRRYDAQPVCCNECGPEVYLLGRDQRGPEAIRTVRAAIRDGQIVGIKGIGGFHLCCDGTNGQAVRTLRERKKRPMKPFALMMKDLETVRRECQVLEHQEEMLTGHQKPIILLERKGGPGPLTAPEVAPDNPKLGVMLPYAPIHHLLFDYRDEVEVPDVLVMTSANTSGAPICRDDQDAEKELTGLCDLILSHNRLIRIRADDTVMDYYKGEPYMIRRSRGFAPLPFLLDLGEERTVLAIGGELKNTFCVGKNQLLYPSPYIGDMGDVRTVLALEESVRRMLDLLEAEPCIIACDLHPGYNTTEFAERLSREYDLPLLKVQHHYAHILSCMAENEWADPVIGVSFDGTGYGTDGTIWGGEILLADYKGFRRLGSLQPFSQTGGDLAAREGWRVAVTLLSEIYGRESLPELAEELDLCTGQEARILAAMADRRINTVTSTSAGRLFDAVSAILGVRRASTFEGEASISLQFAAQRWLEKEGKTERGSALSGMEPEDRDPWHMPTHFLVKKMVEGKREGRSSEELAYCFHEGLADLISMACLRAREETGITTVALSGGVFQNTLLLELTESRLQARGFKVLRHRLTAPNDGGICLGQAAAAMTFPMKDTMQ